MRLEPRYSLGSYSPPRGATVYANVFRLILFKQLAINSRDILTRRGELIFWEHPVVDTNDPISPQTGDWDRFSLTTRSATAKHEGSAVLRDQNPIFLLWRHAFFWRHHVSPNATDHLRFYSDRI